MISENCQSVRVFIFSGTFKPHARQRGMVFTRDSTGYRTSSKIEHNDVAISLNRRNSLIPNPAQSKRIEFIESTIIPKSARNKWNGQFSFELEMREKVDLKSPQERVKNCKNHWDSRIREKIVPEQRNGSQVEG
jgi:hypothetical protein